MCFHSLRGGRTSRDKYFRIKLTEFRSPKTQYYCDQILSKTDQDTWSYDVYVDEIQENYSFLKFKCLLF